MKKLLIILLGILLFPIIAKADMGAPEILSYDIEVTKASGTILYDIDYNDVKGIRIVEDGKVHEGDNTFDIEVYEANCEITFSVGEMPLIENNKVEDDTKSNV